MIDATRATQLRDALARWTVYAREAELEARAQQHDVSVDLLQAARRTALGIAEARRLLEQHDRQAAIVRAARSAAEHAAGRLERRAVELRQLLEASTRTIESIDLDLHASSRRRAELSELRRRATEVAVAAERELASVETASAELAAGRVAADRAAERHDEVSRAIGEARAVLDLASRQANDALALMTEGERQLESLAPLYEAAQLRSIDLRREVFAPPSGLPLAAPSGLAMAAGASGGDHRG